MKKTLTLLSIFVTTILNAQTPCDQRVIENVGFAYTGGGTEPPRWNMSQTKPGGFSIDQAAFTYIPTGNFANQNVDWQNANNNPNSTRQYAIVKNPKDLSPQYADIPTDGMMVINPQQGQNEQYGQFQIANLKPLQTYYVEIKFYNVIALSSRGPGNQCYSWCNWNNQLNILWEGNGNNAHDGQNAMNWTGTNGSGNNSGGWDGWGNQVSNWMWVTPNGANAVMKGQMTLGDATTGFTFTFLKKDGSQTNPIVLGIDYIKIYGCQEEAINVSGGSTNVCEGSDITLTAQGLGSAGSSYTWYQNGVLLPGRNSDTLNIISAIGAGTSVNYEARGEWANKTVILVSKICCSSVGGTSDEVIRQSFNGLTYTCTGGRSGGYADIPDKGTKNFIDPVYIYAGSTCNSLNDGQYAVVQSSYAGDYWRNRPEVKDHTGVAGSGGLFINAIGGVGQAFYKFNLDGLCNGTRYEFSAWYASLATGSETKPNIEFDVMNGAVKIESVTTGIIPENSKWYKAEVTFLTPATGNPIYTLQLVNLVTGSSGNDLMIDDIVVKKCTPSINLFQDGTKDTVLAVCNDNAVNLKVTTFYDLPLAITGSSSGTVYYQWMESTSPNGPWTLIGTPVTTGTYAATPLTTTKYYRVKVSADQARAATGLPPLAAECGNDGMTSSFKLTKDGNFTIPPVTGTTAYCPGAAITLTGDPTATGDQWEWRKGTSFATATVLPGYAFSSDPAKKIFTKTFAAGDQGNYYFIAKQASGCEGNAMLAITASPVATATISGTTTVCQNATNINITFTGANGTAPYTFTYNIDGGTNLTATTAAAANTITVATSTSATGAHVYNLVNVSAGGTSCSNAVTGQSATITVNPLPDASVSGTVTVQQNAASPNITFTGSNGTAPYTFTYNINGGTNQNITTTSGNSVTVPASTATTGTFVYNLVSVKDAGASTCSKTINSAATITVSDLPGAAIAGTATVCKNATAAVVTFTGSNGTAPYTFTYNINGGANLTVTTVTGNAVTVSAPTNATGTFVYTITQVKESSATPVSNTISGQSITVTVEEPAAPTGTNNSRCGTGTVALSAVLSGAASNVLKWYSDVTLTTLLFTGANFTTPNITTTTDYYVTETNAGGCQSPATKVTATVNPGPAVPTGTGAAKCGAGTIALSATLTGGAGNTIKWYSDIALTTQVATGTSFTTPSISTTTDYYITETNVSGCASSPVTVTATINPAASAPVVTPGANCGAGTVTIGATLSGGATDVIKWYSDAALATQVATGTGFTTPSISTTTNYYVTETTVPGCISTSVMVTATINEVPTAGFTAAVDCANKSVSFTNTSNGNGATITEWTWNYDDGTGAHVLANGNAFNWPYPSGGTHNVTLAVKTSAGCSNTTPFAQTIVFGASPAVSFTVGDLCLSNGIAEFTNTSTISDGTLMTYTWDFGDGTPVVNITPAAPPAVITHPYATGGNYNVILTATSNGGCTGTVTKQVSIINIPVANGTIENISNLCSSEPVKLVNTSTITGSGTISKIEVFWDYPDLNNKTTDNQPASGNTYTHDYGEFGTPLTKNYNVVVRAYNINGCSNDFAQAITVLASPKIQLTALPGICFEASPIDISSSATDIFGLGGAISITGDGVSNNVFSPAVAGTGSHTISYTSTAPSGCVATAEQPIVVRAVPVNNFRSSYTVLEGESVVLQPVSPMSTDLTYQWSPASFLDDAGSATPTVTNPPADITYSLKLTSADNCSLDTSVQVVVLSDFVVVNTFTPNNDGVHDKWVIKKLNKYPNHKIQVFNRYGQVVYETTNFPVDGWDGFYKGKLLPFGTYYYIIELGGVRYPKKGFITIIK